MAGPNERQLIAIVRAALDEVARSDSEDSAIETRRWVSLIADEIARRCDQENLGYRCFAGRVMAPRLHHHGSEWLFDFGAYIVDPDDGLMIHAPIIGEIEWNWSKDAIDTDFEKLLVADATLCFMAFQQRTQDDADRELDRLEKAVRRRHQFDRVRNVKKPRAFLLSCYVLESGTMTENFLHREVVAA